MSATVRSGARQRAARVVAGAAVFWCLVGCAASESRGPAGIVVHRLVDGATILTVATCHGDPEVTGLSEDATEVTVEVTFHPAQSR